VVGLRLPEDPEEVPVRTGFEALNRKLKNFWSSVAGI
jgi:hypothetical protein